MDGDYGIRTLLMTDVVGSTPLWAAYPEAMPVALERLEALAAVAVESEGGRIVKARGEGDSLFCTFPTPAAATRAALALVRALRREAWPGGLDLTVRAAVHCGPAHLRGDDLYGALPNRCARLREIGHGGQILLSGAARSHLTPSDGLMMRDLGRHRLRDLDEPESVHQVEHPDLLRDLPPLRSLTALRNNLPAQTTAFVGRDALRRDLLARLRADRLTTLTGAGGSGKTRLALQLGAESIDEFPQGVWFVDLLPHTTEAAVVRAIGEACSVRDLPETDALPVLTDRLRAQPETLLVLDNAEHALAPIAHVVAGLLAGAPDLRLVVTSREPLHVRGERVHRVPPLDVPPRGCADPESVVATEAGALFLDRARLRLPEFEIAAVNAAAVTEIVRRLDGIPLCLEMASSHVGYLGVDQIAARLNDRFALLEGDDPDAPSRHRTMRETISWQVEGLAAPERLLLRRLAVFVGGFALEAAEAVGGVAPLSPSVVLRRLRALVEKSLVVALPDGGGMRYRLLETIAQFAGELEDEGAETAMAALVEWALATATSCEGWLNGPRRRECVELLDKGLPSIHRALDWALLTGDARSVALTLALAPYWFHKGLYLEGRAYLRRAVQVCPPSPQTADILSAEGVFCNQVGDAESAESVYRAALAHPQITPQRRGRCLLNLAIMVNDAERYEEALRLYEEAIQGLSMIEDDQAVRMCGYNRALVLLDLGMLDAARGAFQNLQGTFALSGDSLRTARCLSSLGMIDLLQGCDEAARSLYRRAIEALDDEIPVNLLIDLLIEVSTFALHRGQRGRAAFLFAAHRRLHASTQSRYSPRMLRQANGLENSLDVMEEEVSRAFAEGAVASADELRHVLRETVRDDSRASASGIESMPSQH